MHERSAYGFVMSILGYVILFWAPLEIGTGRIFGLCLGVIGALCALSAPSGPSRRWGSIKVPCCPTFRQHLEPDTSICLQFDDNPDNRRALADPMIRGLVTDHLRAFGMLLTGAVRFERNPHKVLGELAEHMHEFMQRLKRSTLLASDPSDGQPNTTQDRT